MGWQTRGMTLGVKAGATYRTPRSVTPRPCNRSPNPDHPAPMSLSFVDLGLAPNLLKAVQETGYVNPTPIQAGAIPHVLAGKDLLGIAQTGTGKTAAFALPILDRLLRLPPPRVNNPRPALARAKPTRCLVLTPTRELALQVAESFKTYGKHTSFSVAVIFGGVGQRPQEDALRRGVDVLVACPGRLLDLFNQGFVDLSALQVFVLDEADRMLDMGFIHDIKKIVAQIPRLRQTLFFSATMPGEIRALAGGLLHQPETVSVTPVSSTVDRIDQAVYHLSVNAKQPLLHHLLADPAWNKVLVFTRTKHGADRVVKNLLRDDIQAAAIHGNKSQNARVKAIEDFRSGKIRVLVASDIAARGLDIDAVTHVVNFEVPNEPETYVHRIGRTGRAGAAGSAVSFVAGEERAYLKDIERMIRKNVPVLNVPTNLPVLAAPVEPDRPAFAHRGRGAPQGRPAGGRPAFGGTNRGAPRHGFHKRSDRGGGSGNGGAR